jgi:mRNA interferase MazF
VGFEGILIWVAMVTAAENRGWPGDVAVADHLAAGLPIPSVVRTAKVTVIERRRAEWRGRLPDEELEMVQTAVSRWLGTGGKRGHDA